MLQRNKLMKAGFPACSQIVPLRITHTFKERTS
jgi:hypothetical protein